MNLEAFGYGHTNEWIRALLGWISFSAWRFIR